MQYLTLLPLLRYSDLLAKNRKFAHPLSFSALVRGDSLGIYLDSCSLYGVNIALSLRAS